MDENIDRIKHKLKKKLNPLRYEHTLGVEYTAMCLTMRYGGSLKQAQIAGLLHDCAKCYDVETSFKKCEKYGILLTESEHLAPALIHAKLGAVLAEKKYGITDPEILDAIRFHTTGKPDMKLLDKILYVADYIEPERCEAPHLTGLRKVSFIDLDEALFQMMEETLTYLSKNGGHVDDMTSQAYEYYKSIRTSR